MPDYHRAKDNLVVDAYEIVAQLLDCVGGIAGLHSLGVVCHE